MRKLIATDLDGTLVPEGSYDIDPEYFEIIRKLHDRGDVFVAASGRHYSSLRRIFEPVWEDVVFLCGNGTYVTYRDTSMEENALADDLYEGILREMRKYGPDICIDTSKCLWVDNDDRDFIDWLTKGYRNTVNRTDDLMDLRDDTGAAKRDPSCSRGILKCALYTSQDAAVIAEKIRRLYGDRANILSSGARWVDCVPLSADKGSALAHIQEKFGISREDTIAFGDNGNDVGMLLQAGRSYCVENGRKEAREAAGRVIGRQEDGAVLGVLRDLLRKDMV